MARREVSRHEILLRYIGDIFGVGVFGKEMIEGWSLRGRTSTGIDCTIPRLFAKTGPRRRRYPERYFRWLDDLAYGEFRDTGFM